MLLVAARAPLPLVRCARRAGTGVALAIEDLGAGAALVPLWIWWGVWRGGEPDSVWLGALPLLALAALVLARWRAPARPRGAVGVCLGAGVGLVAWSAASILWAADQGAALTATQRLALYVGSLALVVTWPPSGRGLRLLVGAFILAGVAGAVVVLSRSGGGGRLLIDGRLAGPTGYPNATAALFAMTGLAGLGLAVHARAARTGAGWASIAAVLLADGLLAQSRAAAVALGVSLCVAVALSYARGKVLSMALAIGGGLLAVSGALLSVRTRALHGIHPGLGVAGVLLAAAATAGLLAFLLLRALRLRLPIPRLRLSIPRPRLGVRSPRMTVVVLAGVLVAGTIGIWAPALVRAGEARLGMPDYVRLEQGSSRFTGDTRSYRPDYWRVALAGVAEQPLLGTGAGSFGERYLLERRTTKAPQHAHSVWLETLAELGIPGLVLLLVACGALARAVSVALRRTRGADLADHAVRLAAALPLVFLALHASVDWVSVFPVLAVPALALAAAVAAARADRPRRATPALAASRCPRRRLLGGRLPVPRHPARTAAGLVVVLAAALALPTLAAVRLTDHALASWPGHPAAALDELRLAARLNPLSARAPLALGIVALEERRPATAALGLGQATRRNGADWLARYASGLLAAAQGQHVVAEAWLGAALGRNPREPLVAAAMARVHAGPVLEPLDGVRRALAEPG